MISNTMHFINIAIEKHSVTDLTKKVTKRIRNAQGGPLVSVLGLISSFLLQFLFHIEFLFKGEQ